MSGLFQKEEGPYGEPVHQKKELKLAPGYLILTLWILFTLALSGWVLMTSFSTTKKIFNSKLLESEFHMENYVRAWVDSNAPTIFFNSLSYTVVSCTPLILICVSIAYALSRFDSVCNRLIQLSLMASMGVPTVMIVLPLFAMVTGLSIFNNVSVNQATLILLYIEINIPYTTIFLTTFFANLSRAFEEAAAIDGYPPVKTFWLIILPMTQPGIVTVIIFSFINIWNEYFISPIFGGPDKVRSAVVSLYSVISSMKYAGDWVGMLSATVIVFLSTLIPYIFLSERIIAGVTGGDVKG